MWCNVLSGVQGGVQVVLSSLSSPWGEGTAVRSRRRLLATATDGGPPAWQPRKPAAASAGKDLRSLMKLMVFWCLEDVALFCPYFALALEWFWIFLTSFEHLNIFKSWIRCLRPPRSATDRGTESQRKVGRAVEGSGRWTCLDDFSAAVVGVATKTRFHWDQVSGHASDCSHCRQEGHSKINAAPLAAPIQRISMMYGGLILIYLISYHHLGIDVNDVNG